MKFTLHIWRQENARAKGHFETYEIDNISADCSFLEMLDQLNEKLINDHIAHPVCFDNDCREGICGMCGLYINGRPTATTTASPPASSTCATSMTATRSG